MKFQTIFRLEFNYQLRQVSTWLYFAVVLVLAFLFIQGNYVHDAREGYFLLNAPIVIATSTVLSCVFWLLIGGAIAGDAAARDVISRMFSLTFTAPSSKAAYLGGRFFAAFTLNTIILTGIPAGVLIAIHFSGVEGEILGPFRLSSYLTSYFFILLPNSFFVTAIQFSLATLGRKAMGSYFGGVLLFVLAYVLGQAMQNYGQWGNLIDPMSLTPVLGMLSNKWTPMELNTHLFYQGSSFIANRFLWLLISIGIMAHTYLSFRFTNPAAERSGKSSKLKPEGDVDSGRLTWEKTQPLPRLTGVFGYATYFHQLKLITSKAFRTIATNWTGLILLGLIALIIAFAMPGNLKMKEVPLLPRTDHVVNLLVGPLANPGKFWILIFLLTIFYAGELVWRERESGLDELANAAPVPEWILFLSKFLALCFLLLVWLAFLMAAGALAQLSIGGSSIDWGLYLKALFGFQFFECLIFISLVLTIHVMVNQKYIAHLLALLVFAGIMYSTSLGLEHKLLIYGSSPAWKYTYMGGFSLTVQPWLWFKVYWLAWALLLAVTSTLFWVRSREVGLIARLKLAKIRLSRGTAMTAAVAVGLILTTGGFIFYNTNILNKYESASEISAGRAIYEHRYGKYRNMPQPQLTHANLHVEIYPERRVLELKGTFLIVNKHSVPIDTIIVAIPAGAKTTGIRFDRTFSKVQSDNESGMLTYALGSHLKPGDTLHFDFKVYYEGKGFTNNGADAVVLVNGTKIRNYELLPVIGYQPYRELDDRGLRKEYGLTPRNVTASLYNPKYWNYAPFAEQIYLNAVIGTAEGQTVVAPGALRKSWKSGNRQYFHYITDKPIRNEYTFFSANYAVRQEKWIPLNDPKKPIDIQLYYDPGATENLERMMRSAKASLIHYSKQFGPYPHRQVRFMAHPGYGMGNHAAPINITAEEGFFLLNPNADERGFDLVTAVVAHEIAHQWWGNYFKSADVEGAGLLSESLAWYSAMGVMEESYGSEHLKKLLSFLREEYEVPRTKAALPLLQAGDWYQNYRKGPFAVYTMSKYIGKQGVDSALSKLIRRYPPGIKPMPTSLNLYEELEAVTPDSLRYLLHDLFKQNTFWDLSAKHAIIDKPRVGSTEKSDRFRNMTFKLRARKIVVDVNGLEKDIPLNDWIEIGAFAPVKKGEDTGKLLYLQKHFINSNQQSISLKIPTKAVLVAIDPNHLLVDWNIKDNFVSVKE